MKISNFGWLCILGITCVAADTIKTLKSKDRYLLRDTLLAAYTRIILDDKKEDPK